MIHNTRNKTRFLVSCIIVLMMFASCSSDGDGGKSVKTFKEDVYLFTQEEVDAFGAEGYERVEGWMYIGYSDQLNNSINDLSSLSTLRSVDGLLHIYGNEELTTLSGLENLEDVARLEVYRNSALQHIDHLSGLTTVGALFVSDNAELTNLDGLSNLNSAYEIAIGEMPLLADIDALSNITNLEGGFGISDCPSLTNLNGISGLSGTTGNLQIWNMDGITDLSAFSKVTSVELAAGTYGYLQIRENDALTILTGLENITAVMEDTEIRDNRNLTNLCAISNLVVNGGIGRDLVVLENAYNPSQQDFQQGICEAP